MKSEKLIINLCPTGMIPTREMTPHLPQTPDEIICDIDACFRHGLGMVHLHARDENGLPTYKKEAYAAIIEKIRSKFPDLVIVVSTSGRTFSEFEQRSDVLELTGDQKPDMASLTLSSVNFNKIASVNSPDMIINLAAKMQEKGIKPELEIFDLGMVNYAHYLIKKGLLTPPYYFNIILGNIATAQARLLPLGLIVSELPDNSIWSLGGVGDCQSVMNAFGTIIGDGVRVGIEDNIWYDSQRSRLATNEQLVSRVVKIAATLGRQIAPPEEVRQRLALRPNRGMLL